MSIGRCFTEFKRLQREAGHLPPSTTVLTNGVLLALCTCAALLSHTDFTFPSVLFFLYKYYYPKETSSPKVYQVYFLIP
jgi:hypothetical protein